MIVVRNIRLAGSPRESPDSNTCGLLLAVGSTKPPRAGRERLARQSKLPFARCASAEPVCRPDLDATRGGDSTKAIAAARELVEEFRDHLDTDERVEACDDNPFEIKVTIRESLDKALLQMEQVLGKALAG